MDHDPPRIFDPADAEDMKAAEAFVEDCQRALAYSRLDPEHDLLAAALCGRLKAEDE